MKVEYIKCDICNTKIQPGTQRYKYKYLTSYLPDDFSNNTGAMEVTLDICDACFDEMRNWISSKKGNK